MYFGFYCRWDGAGRGGAGSLYATFVTLLTSKPLAAKLGSVFSRQCKGKTRKENQSALLYETSEDICYVAFVLKHKHLKRDLNYVCKIKLCIFFKGKSGLYSQTPRYVCTPIKHDPSWEETCVSTCIEHIFTLILFPSLFGPDLPSYPGINVPVYYLAL